MKSDITPPQLLYTMKQAAAALQICERSLWTLLDRGEIPKVKIGSSVRVDVRDLQAWIDKKKGGTA